MAEECISPTLETHNPIGNFPEAIESYTKALQIFQTLEDKGNESGALCNLGTIEKSRGVSDSHTEYYQKASEITQELGNKRTQGINQGNNIGDLFLLTQH